MSDQEVLSMAAKAVGLGPIVCYESARKCLRIGNRESYTRWRPLTHSDDALALAVSIPGLDLQWVIAEAWQARKGLADRMAYVRRVIVDKAAQIGRLMT